MLMSTATRLESHGAPFGFLEPTIQFSDDDQEKLDQRGIVLRILPADGHELAVLAGSVHVDPGSFTSTVKNIADLKRGALVPQIGRFAAHPRLEDLRELTLDPADVEEVKKCKPEHCGLKLAPEEIAQLQGAVSDDHGDSRALDNAFRQVVLERAKAYLLRGDDITKQQFSLLIQHSPYVEARGPAARRLSRSLSGGPPLGC